MPPSSCPARHAPFTSTRRLVLANLLLIVGFNATYFVGIIGSATYQLGADALSISMLIVGLNITVVTGAALSGVFIDRVGPRLTTLVASAVLALSGIIALLLPLSFPMLAAVECLEGLAYGAVTSAVSAYPRFLTRSPHELQHMNSLCGTASSVAVILGPVIGGAITAASTNQACFATLPVASIAAMPFVWLTPEVEKAGGPSAASPAGPGPADAKAENGFLRQLVEGVRITFAHGTLRTLFLVYFMGFFAYGAFDSLESLFYRDVLQVSGDWMGWLSACAGVGATVGSLAVLRVSTKRITISTLSLLLLVTGVGSMIYVGTSNLAVAVVGQLITGLGFGAMRPVKDTILQRSCKIEYMGRVASVLNAGTNSAGVIPLLLAPFVADVFGVQGTLFGASAAVAAIAVAALAHCSRRQ